MDTYPLIPASIVPPLEKGGLGGDQPDLAIVHLHIDPHPKISAKFSTSPFQGEVKGGAYV